MTTAHATRILVVLLALSATAGCGSDGFSPSTGGDVPAEEFIATTALGPTALPDSAMMPVAVAAGVPAPVSDVVSFYATNREDRSVSILLPDTAGAPSFDDHGHGHGHGHDPDHGHGGGHGPPDNPGHGVTPGDGPGSPLGAAYVRLTVWPNSLLAWPDGHPVAGNDSVLITVRLVDRSKLLFEFEPSGLRFSVSKPAELRVNYGLALEMEVIAAVKELKQEKDTDVARLKADNDLLHAENARLKADTAEMKTVLCELRPGAGFCAH